MLNVIGTDVTGPALTTVTLTGPGVAICAAETDAVSLIELTSVVVSAVPPHCTVDVATKFVPPRISVKAGPPAVAEYGLSPEMVGTAPAGTMVNGIWFDNVPAPF